MESIDRLRRWADCLQGTWIDKRDGTITFTTGGDVPPDMDSVSLRDHVNGVLDEIEREVGERYVALPIDADGIPWHVGDMTENGNVVNGMTIDFHGWHFTGTRNDIDPAIHRHYVPKPTVEDVLKEFINEYCRDDSELTDGEIFERFAAKLQLKED